MSWFQTERCNSWLDIQQMVAAKFADPYIRWIFRGQQNSNWGLTPSLERVARDQFGLPHKHHAFIEWRLQRRFMRNLHRFATRVPRENDDIEWLALMQHHGAPTRLLDWTYSFYVALFFAIERAMPGQSCAVWAIDQRWLMDTLHKSKHVGVQRAFRLDWSLKTPKAMRILLRAEPTIVVPLVPYYLNERLAVQQGVFLAPMNLGRSFMDNLRAATKTDALREHVVKVEISIPDRNYPNPVRNHWYMLACLNRLNVNRLSLFPGIDGFASSLAADVSWTRHLRAGWREQRDAEATPNQPLQRKRRRG